MREYTFTILSRDKEHKLDQEMILELGFDQNRPIKLIEGLQNIVDMLKLLKTPENVAQFMLDSAQLTNNFAKYKDKTNIIV